MKVIFMGSPDFAVPCLDMLIREYNVVAVVTQPDRPKGRGGKISATPVKDRALSAGIPVLQPVSIKEPEVIEQIRSLTPDIIITAAYGQIIPPAILDIPKFGCINVHASLLPKYRGASPIHWSIINGEEETGITIMLMDEGMDTGDILLQSRLSIGRDETAGQLHDRLSQLAVDTLKKAVEGIQRGTIVPIPQDHDKATYCPKLDKSMGAIDWSKSPRDVKNLVRGLNPWPGAYTYYKNNMVKIWNVNIIDIGKNKDKGGTIIKANSKEGIWVAAGDGIIEIKDMQVAGSRRMDSRQYMMGHHWDVGEILTGKIIE